MTTVNVLPFGTPQTAAAKAQQPTDVVTEVGQTGEGDVSGESLFSPLLLQMILAQQTPQQVIPDESGQLPASQNDTVEDTEINLQQYTLFGSTESVNELISLNNQKNTVSIETVKGEIQIYKPLPNLPQDVTKKSELSTADISIELDTDVTPKPIMKNDRQTEIPVDQLQKSKVMVAEKVLPKEVTTKENSKTGMKIELDITQTGINTIKSEKDVKTIPVKEQTKTVEKSTVSVSEVIQTDKPIFVKAMYAKVQVPESEKETTRSEVKPVEHGTTEKITKTEDAKEKPAQYSEQQPNGFSKNYSENQPKQFDSKEQKQFVVQQSSAPIHSIGALKQPEGPNTASLVHVNAETIQSVVEQVSKNISAALNDSKSEMKITLHPESLGEVMVKVQIEEGKVSTQLDVQQTQVKNIIEANLPQLKEALTNKGLTVDRIDVFASELSSKDQASQQQQKKNHSGSSRSKEENEEVIETSKLFGYNTIEYVF
jgi:flagellar hook-length control protein FliK